MDKSSITREMFNYNFLDKGILRLDYSGVIEIENTIQDISTDLKEAGFTSVIEGYINEVSIKLSDPVKIETIRSVPVEEFARNKSYKFTNPHNKAVIEITKFFTTLTIDYSTYIKFEEYRSIFANVLKEIKSKNPFIKPLRIGERKINSLFIFNEENIHEYFEAPFFINLLQSLNVIDPASETVTHNAVDTLKIRNKNVNISRHKSKGLLRGEGGDQEVSRLILDIDCYSIENPEVTNILNEDNVESKLDELNILNFEIYKQALTDHFIEILTSQDADFDGKTIGVKKNV